ncbi:MAG: FAD-dependent oxidoreductase, partial [Candidatus Thiodiazotropha sp. 6PLUC10]
MSGIVDVTLPDIGDFEQVDIIEILVSPGDRVDAEDSIITLESDKATMDIPSPHSGTIKEVVVKVGEKISMGATILKLELESGANVNEKPEPTKAPVSDVVKGAADKQVDVVVLGAGPGGYTAAFRAADLGKRVILIERYDALGGVCLNVGCIPSKALLHAAAVINEAAEMAELGVSFGKPKVDLDKLRAGKDKVVQKLTGGLKALAKQRKVEVVHGIARFESPKRIAVNGAEGTTSIDFTDAIIACGSSPVKIPGFPNDDPRLIDSTGALELADIPKRMLVVGGGIIGLEMATVYCTLGSQIDVVELQENLIPGCDPDLVRPLQKR